ncbi:hypothetical protein F5876DRAFT_53629 [Lentinula aff. lateritia]|uniref:Uncharacterized protein n=1 Tax=Lentinula aff. lateritia TaxID=2804960 RepID=A0ACC1THK3_9AGAR|nr:hypothetical protein F5876DRAFT_53629 [Lentinula aff. lateritia]
MALETHTLSLAHLTLNPDEYAFYKKQTGIEEEEILKQRIAQVAQKAVDVYPYHCICTFGFLRFRILRSQSGYKQLLELGATRANALFLDLGCCFGNDLRKAIEDGFPAQNVIASDLRPDFWNFGHELFNTDPTTFPVTFIPGNVLDPAFISLQPPLLLHESPPSVSPTPTSLTPLRGHLSAIHTSAFFHLFNKDEQLLIAQKLASLLSPVPGSVVFGSHRGAGTPWEGEREGEREGDREREGERERERGGTVFYRHSPASWKEMWERDVFGGADLIRVDAGLALDDRSREILWWTVTRL